MQASKRNILISVTAFIWFCAVVLTYYISHKPFDPTFIVQVGMAIWRLLLAAFIISVAGGLGRKFLRVENLHPLTQVAIQAAFGLGIYALIILGLGWLIGLTTLLLWGVVLVSTVILRRDMIGWWQCFKELSPAVQSPDRLSRWATGYVVLVAGFSLLAALAPPIKFDALVYHLLMPRAYLDTGQVEYLPWLMMSGMPQTAEMLYTWVAGLAGGIGAASVLGWMVGVLATIGVYGYIDREVGRRPAWIAVAALFGGYSAVASLAWGYVDWFTLLFGLAFMVLIDQWSRTDRPAHLIFAGVCAGFALGTKVPAGFLVVVGEVIVIWQTVKNRRNIFTVVLLFGAVAAVTTLPWWLKNLIATGNPIYPLLFEAGAMTKVRLQIFQNLPAWGDWTDLVILPLKATLTGVAGGPGYDFSLGPLLLALAVCAWVGKQVSGQLRALRRMAAVITVVGIVIWAVANQFSGYLAQTRMYMAIFPAVTVLAALGYAQLATLRMPSVRLNRLVEAMIVVVLAFNAIELGAQYVNQGTLSYLMGLTTSDEYLQTNLGVYAPAMKAIRDLPEGERVLLLVEPRSLYCYPKCRPDESLDRWPRDYAQYQTSERILKAWKEEGFSQVMYYKSGAEYLRDTKDINHTDEEWVALDEFLSDLPTPVDYYGAYELYRLP